VAEAVYELQDDVQPALSLIGDQHAQWLRRGAGSSLRHRGRV
jgi:hypothetical protein